MENAMQVEHTYALLFWYVNERNWTVQSTSTIVKPRRDPHEYAIGDVVCAKFSGKIYRAVIVGLNESKDELLSARIKLDHLLKDMSLSATAVMKEMGVEVTLNLDEGHSTADSVVGKGSGEPASKTSKRASNVKGPVASKKLKQVPADATVSKQTKDAMRKEKQDQRESALAASRLMAESLLKGCSGEEQTHTTSGQETNIFTTNTPTFSHNPSVTAPTWSNQSQIAWSNQNQSNYNFTYPSQVHHNESVCQGQNYYYGSPSDSTASSFLASLYTDANPGTSSQTQQTCNCDSKLAALEQRILLLEEKYDKLDFLRRPGTSPRLWGKDQSAAIGCLPEEGQVEWYGIGKTAAAGVFLGRDSRC